jgi:hypothetical protein
VAIFCVCAGGGGANGGFGGGRPDRVNRSARSAAEKSHVAKLNVNYSWMTELFWLKESFFRRLKRKGAQRRFWAAADGGTGMTLGTAKFQQKIKIICMQRAFLKTKFKMFADPTSRACVTKKGKRPSLPPCAKDKVHEDRINVFHILFGNQHRINCTN